MSKRAAPLSELIGSLYTAVEHPAEWVTFLDRLRLAMDATGAAIMHYDTSAPALAVQAFVGFDDDAVSLYHSHYRQVDPWGRALKPPDWVPGRVVNGLELVADDEVRRGESYNDFGRRFGCVRAAFGLLEPIGARIGFFTVNRGDRQPAFGAEDMRLLEELTPHLRQAFRLQRRLAAAEAVSDDLAGVLDSTARAVFLLNAAGKVSWLNRAAERLIAARDGLIVDDGELRAAVGADTTRLRTLVAEAAATATGHGTGAGGALPLGRPTGRRPLMALVVPLTRRPAFCLHSEPPVAMVIVTDPDRVMVPDVETLRALLGLTSAEAVLTRLVAQGATLGEAAARLGLRTETVRTRMKTIFEKTNTHRQADLIRLVLLASSQS